MNELKRLEAEYLERRAEIRSDPELSWEKRERAIRELGKEYDKALRSLSLNYSRR